MNTTTSPVYIRRSSYRGKEGFSVKSRMGGIFGTSIFVETREAAEICKLRVQRGQEVSIEDMRAGL